MPDFDVFNGDADGICALLQLRQADPRDAQLVTGVKRDIALLGRVNASAGDRVTVLDVAMGKNQPALDELLETGADVFYADHHVPGDIPQHDNLEVHIDTASDTCTSLIVNGLLGGAAANWAVVGAYGDNLNRSAETLADRVDLPADARTALRDLGTYVNYNGYGTELKDLLFDPAQLFRLFLPYRDPLEFLAAGREEFETLRSGYHDDMESANAVAPSFDAPHAAVFMLPDAPWARRVSGVFGNGLANASPARAHAVITARGGSEYVVSVRAPLESREGAAEICSRFATGGGRAAAAGINRLPEDDVDRFVREFSSFYGGS